MVAWHACPICCAHIQPHDDTHRVKLCVDGSLVLCICRALAQHDQPMVVAQHDHSSDGHGVEDFASRSSKQEAGRRTRLGCRPHLLRTHTPTPTERSSAWMDARQPERMRRIAADSVGKCAERARGVSTRSAHCPPLRAECREELSHAGAGWGGEGGACTPHALSEPASRRNVCGAHPHQRSPARPPDGRRCRRYTQQMGSGPGWRWWSRQSGARRLWWPRSERAEPGARRGGRGVKHVGRQARRGYLESIVHIDASLRVSAIASCRPAPADGCAQTHAGQARGGSAGQRGWHHAIGGGTPAGWDRRRSSGCRAWA